jgi:hypothetical protein
MTARWLWSATVIAERKVVLGSAMTNSPQRGHDL